MSSWRGPFGPDGSTKGPSKAQQPPCAVDAAVMRAVRQLLMIAFLGLTTPAQAQETLEEWEDDVQLWEQPWEETWWGPPTGGRLTLTLGRRSGFLQSDLAGPSDLSSQTEIYAMAGLEVPWAGLLSGERREGTRKSSQQGTQKSASRGKGSEEQTDSAETSESKASRADEEKTTVAEEEPVSEKSARGEGAEESGEKAEPEARGQGASPASQQADKERRDGSRSDLLVLLREVMVRLEHNQGFLTEEARIARLARRSRRSGLAPELRLRGVYGFDQTTSLEDATGLYPGETTTRGGRDSLAEVRLTFRLDRLVYGDDETTLERHRTSQRDVQRKITQTAVDLVLKWWQSERGADDPELLPEEQAECAARAEAALVNLHLLTGGWFRGRGTLRALGLEL